jgi:hypothetical protein
MGLTLSRSWLRFAPILVVAACASSSGGETETTPAAATTAGSALAVIEVMHNNMSNSGTLTIMVTPAAGIVSSLGVIDPGQTKRFNYDAPAGNYRLSVQGTNIQSNSFRLSNREIARWDMQTNRVTVFNK